MLTLASEASPILTHLMYAIVLSIYLTVNQHQMTTQVLTSYRKTDLEDALKRLDKLTQEDARMATAEVLKASCPQWYTNRYYSTMELLYNPNTLLVCDLC